jgi:hypothetical protein
MDSEDEEEEPAAAAPAPSPEQPSNGMSTALASAKEKMDRGVKKVAAASAVKKGGKNPLNPLPDEACG